MQQIKEKIRGFLARFFFTDEIKDEDNIFKIESANSLFTMQLLMFLESEFNIHISNEEIDVDNFKSINPLLNIWKIKVSLWNNKNFIYLKYLKGMLNYA